VKEGAEGERERESELAFNRLFAMVGSGHEGPDVNDPSASGGSMMGVVAQSRLRTGKTVVNRPAAASRSTTYPTLTALAIRALSAVVRIGQFG
jgi:hypothetical protein